MDEDPKAEGDRIARLLEEVRGMAGPSTWQRVEELVQRLVRLYGAGLGRVLELVADAGRLDASLRGRLCEDELVASLLLLHGLHPVPTAERVASAVETLRERLAPDLRLELAGVEGGVARLRLAGAAGGCASSAAAVARAIEQQVLEAAPELARVEIEGAPAAPSAPGERLVTLGRPRAGAEASSP
jgi:Fe-S cluster biogenesis protein NfuA